MAGNGSESFTSRSIDHEVIPQGPEEEMDVGLALRRSREAAALRKHSDSQRQKSIASAQLMPGSGIAVSQEAARSIWRPSVVADVQPLRWRTKEAHCASSDANMARRWTLERRSHTIRRPECGRRNCIVVDIISFHEGSVSVLTSTDIVQITGSDKEV
ncbi:Omega-6 fatty acid desaturase, endoplasmic reticulum isozyme 2 [Hordeum vulgare]|nr:Omega-6 fatty acid desaturase, endoplasmic reticulum isozyme 2 [Hordeum vulgare]